MAKGRTIDADTDAGVNIVVDRNRGIAENAVDERIEYIVNANIDIDAVIAVDGNRRFFVKIKLGFGIRVRIHSLNLIQSSFKLMLP